MVKFFKTTFKKIGEWFKRLGLSIAKFFKELPKNIKNLFFKIIHKIRDKFLYYLHIFKEGDLGVKLSFIFMGAGQFARKQIAKGIAYLPIPLNII
ncbi:MAG: hypothetical protein K6F59_04355 [Gammaproteobacteria bacterium]|nr:hypothetical protein [Gammaproteobacteria bacterium]